MGEEISYIDEYHGNGSVVKNLYTKTVYMDALILSPNPDTLLYTCAEIAGISIPNLELKNIKLKVFVKEPCIGPNCNLLQLAKQERLDTIERIHKFDTPIFEVAKNEVESDVVITIQRKHCKRNGRRYSVVVTRWDFSHTAEILWGRGVSLLKEKNLFLDPLNGINSLGRVPSTHFGHIKPKGMILNAPGLLKDAAHLLVMKALLAK